jgi:arylsulfatase
MRILTTLLAIGIALPFFQSCKNNTAPSPNILLIMVDDLGFSDLGCYGGEIATPSLDALAAEGLRFTQFYNTAKCHSSRVSLLTGLYCTQAGDESLRRATTIPQLLGEVGYFTSMTGKWHLHQQPTDFGFMRYWGHLSGATDFFLGDSTFRHNGEFWNDFGEDFYTTDANIDFSIEFIDEALSTGKPFFHYIAFNAPHFPLQAPREEVEKYLGTYDEGWERIRKARFEKQQRLGLFPEEMELPPIPGHIPDWASLSDNQREFESFRMSVYAGMVDRIDQNMGRLLGFLEERGALENTLVLFCSDNGGCPYERSRFLEIPPWEGESRLFYDASWAAVSNTPLKHYKQNQHEGGISTPLIVHWPGRIRNPGEWERSPAHLIDIMATCLEISGGTYPQREGLQPLMGKSLVPLFSGREREGHEELYFIFRSCRALRRGDWKVVSFYGNPWELYNVAEDRFEQHDLAEEYPGKVKELSDRWHEMAEYTDLQPEEMRKPVKAIAEPVTHLEWHRPELTEGWKGFGR